MHDAQILGRSKTGRPGANAPGGATGGGGGGGGGTKVADHTFSPNPHNAHVQESWDIAASIVENLVTRSVRIAQRKTRTTAHVPILGSMFISKCIHRLASFCVACRKGREGHKDVYWAAGSKQQA